MRIKRNIVAPALLTLGAVGSVLAGPIMALTTAAAPSVSAAAAGTIKPNITYYHG